MVGLLLFALVASVYVVQVLEIFKLRRLRLRQRMGLGGAVPPPAGDLEAEVDAGVKRELDTGEYAAVPAAKPRPPEPPTEPPQEPPTEPAGTSPGLWKGSGRPPED